jgi:Family of unknown function (DUF6152)
MICKTLRRAVLCGLLALPGLVRAHHSTAFYVSDFTELEGDLVDVQWRNPHTQFVLRTQSETGEEEVWRLEGSSIYNLQRGGVSRDLFKVGDHVRVAGHKSRQRAFEFQITNMLLPDGHEAVMWTGAAPRWQDGAFGSKDGLAGTLSAADVLAENRGLFRVWSVPLGVARKLDLPFTKEAVAARSAYDLLDNFATHCEQEGMPRIMVNPHPFEFIDHGATITLRTELYDISRTIHMDRSEPPAGEPATHLVTTTHVDWPYFDNIGTPQSRNVRIVERYTLSPDQRRLDYSIEVADPATFTRPATMAGYWLALGDKIMPYQCQPRP